MEVCNMLALSGGGGFPERKTRPLRFGIAARQVFVTAHIFLLHV